VGELGPQGGAGVLSCWTSYREFWFENDSAEIVGSEKDKMADVAAYINRNPSLQVGIDGCSLNDPRQQNLCDRRTKAVADALVAAGVPSHRVSVGAYGDVQLRRDRRVEVLINSAD